jgi:nucleotide-binding universal stress UspA family protein
VANATVAVVGATYSAAEGAGRRDQEWELRVSADPIVVGTDGSATAERAVERAAELAQALGARVCIVNSYATPTGAWMAAASGIAVPDMDLDTQNRSEAEEVIRRAKRVLTDRGVESCGHICSGDAAQALMAVAEDEGAQMIIVGNRGMTGARRMLGSVPNRVSHQARCPVLIVPTS